MVGVHQKNFIDSIRGEAKPNADVTSGVLAAGICHLANIALTVGRTLEFDPAAETFPRDREANALVRRTYRDHWSTPKGV